jgi:hypothetical protein
MASLAVGCATSSEADAPDPLVGQIAQPLGVHAGDESGSVWSVAGKTPVVPDLVEFSVGAPLKFKLKATAARTVDILLEARGLDGRAVTRVIQGGLAMAANSVINVNIDPSQIPVQSVGGVVQITLKARYVESGATVVSPLGPETIFVTHSIGYNQAWATTGNLLTLGIAAREARLAHTVGIGDVIAKSASFESDPATDIPLAQDMLKMARFETGRFEVNGIWTTMAAAQANSPYKGGGSFRWPTKLYNKVRSVVGIDPVAWTLLPAPITVTVCPTVSPVWRDSGSEAVFPAAVGNVNVLPTIGVPLPTVGAVLRTKDDQTISFNGRLDANGCAQTQIFDDAPCMAIEVRTDQVGSGTTKFSVLGAARAGQPATSFTYTIGVCYNAAAFIFLPAPAPPPSFAPTVSSVFNEPVARVLPIAARIASIPDSGFLSGSAVHILNTANGCPGYSTTIPGVNSGACYEDTSDITYFGVAANPVTKVALDFETTQEKFVIAHELGHLAQAWSSGNTAVDYKDAPGLPSACTCDRVVSSNRDHCLNSRENISTASTEGWGHFMSARLLNDTTQPCIFNYYKEIWDGVDAMGLPKVKTPPAATRVSCTTPKKWRNTNCAQVETGTEWDWMTFLMNVHTQGVSKLNMTELTDVWKLACGSATAKCNGQALTWASTTSPIAGVTAAPVDNAAKAKFGIGSMKYNHWLLTADGNGVSNNLAP